MVKADRADNNYESHANFGAKLTIRPSGGPKLKIYC